MSQLLRLWPFLALAALLALAWVLARLLPYPEEPSAPLPPPPDPYVTLLERLPEEPAPAVLAAEVLSTFHLQLTQADVAAWRTLVAEGTAPAQALRTVIESRRAALSGVSP